MFKNCTPYLLPKAADLMTAELPEQLAAIPFKPCGPTEPTSWGFVPPTLKDGAALAEQLGGGRIVLAVRRQERKVPGETLKKRVGELAKAIEDASGRKPGAKRRRELKEEALLELLPQAFTRDTTALVLIDTAGERLVAATTSTGMLDGVLSALVKAIPGFAPQPWNTIDSPASWMAKLLIDGDLGTGFAIGRDLELCSSDVNERRVAWRNADLSGEDVQQNLGAGASVVRLALEFNARTAFVLTETGQLRGLTLDLSAFAQPGEGAEVIEWRTDAELWTAELVLVLSELERELGGGAILPAVEQLPGPGEADAGAADPLFDQAVTVVFKHKRASISLIQRHLAIGYNRAASLLEAMEAKGLVSGMKTGMRELLK